MSEQNTTTVDVAPSVKVEPPTLLVSVSCYQIPDFATRFYRVLTPKGATTEVKPRRVLAAVAAALGIVRQTRAAKPASTKAGKK